LRLYSNLNLYVLCVSDDGPDTDPHAISQGELSATFNNSKGWNVATIEADSIQASYHDDGAPSGSRPSTQIISVSAQRLHWIRRSRSTCRENTGGRGASPERKH
jgi:hypothetical protein